MPPLPDPLAREAENQVHALIRSASEKKIRLPDDDEAMCEIRRVFALSPFVAKSCVNNPGMLAGFFREKMLDRPCDADEYLKRLAAEAGSAADDGELMAALRRARNREMVRIAWRDLTGRADLFSTMSELSAFASATLSLTCDILYEHMCAAYGTPVSDKGEPQRLVIIGLGKLGGGELNFSSDIDIMFAFPETGMTTGGDKAVSNSDFFLKLARKLINIIGRPSADGLVFRVDTRLRPFGDSGPLVMSFDAMENYYQSFGREWERYALIKARPVAGDKEAGKSLIELLTPFIFRRYIDYGTFDTLREMKAMISREVARKGMQDNVKHGPGGIREIEFFGQVFQIIRGGVDRRYRTTGIIDVLELLLEDGMISAEVHKELSDAYVFLRNTEHGIQMASDVQSHVLPSCDMERLRLATRMGYADWDDFHAALSCHMERVHGHFNDLLAPKPGEKHRIDAGIESIWRDSGERGGRAGIVEKAGFKDPEAALGIIDEFKHRIPLLTRDAISLQRIDRLMPKLIAGAGKAADPDAALRKLIPLVESIARRSCYISLLLENPGVLHRLVKLADMGPWLITFLSNHPLLLDELIDPRDMDTLSNRRAFESALHKRLQSVSDDDPETQMDEIRVFKQLNMFRIAMQEVSGRLPLMKISDRLTFLAEAIIRRVVLMAWRHLADRYGEPSTCRAGRDSISGDPAKSRFPSFYSKRKDFSSFAIGNESGWLHPHLRPALEAGRLLDGFSNNAFANAWNDKRDIFSFSDENHREMLFTSPSTPGFAVIAYGKLGGLELGYRSDLDLVFLHTADTGFTKGGSMKPIANSEFYARLGQRIIHYLSAATSAGRLYDVDMRLRPSGAAGMLVSNIDSFASYQQKHAWTWEHQALIKARPICGDPEVAERFGQIRKEVLGMRRDPVTLASQVVEMREKMRAARRGRERDEKKGFDIKNDPGGVVDIEFLVQYLILANAERCAMLTNWTDVVRQLNALSLCGVIDDLTAHALKQAYLVYRHEIHRLNLMEKPVIVCKEQFAEQRKRVIRIWNRYLSWKNGNQYK